MLPSLISSFYKYANKAGKLTIEEFDKILGIYYKRLGKENEFITQEMYEFYDDEKWSDGTEKGLFARYCEENGFDGDIHIEDDDKYIPTISIWEWIK